MLPAEQVVMRHSIRRRGNASLRDRSEQQFVGSEPAGVSTDSNAPKEGTERSDPAWEPGESEPRQESLGGSGKRSCRQQRTRAQCRTRSRFSAPKAGPQAAATLTLVQRLESIERGMRPLELATLIGVGKSTLYDWVDAGTIPAYRHRGVIFFDPALIAAWLSRQATQGS